MVSIAVRRLIRRDLWVLSQYASVMAHGCGLNAWRPNSQIGHAVSNKPAGPYTLQSIVLPHFAHSPEVIRGTKGEWLIFHVGAGADNRTLCPDPAAPSCRWATNCSNGCTGPEHPWLSGLSFFGPSSVLNASNPDGPWSDNVIGSCTSVPGCEPNPRREYSCSILRLHLRLPSLFPRVRHCL